jgi:hypothetical protein
MFILAQVFCNLYLPLALCIACIPPRAKCNAPMFVISVVELCKQPSVYSAEKLFSSLVSCTLLAVHTFKLHLLWLGG